MRNGTGVDGERIPEVVLNGCRKVAEKAWNKVPPLRARGERSSSTADETHVYGPTEADRMKETREQLLSQTEEAATRKAQAERRAEDPPPPENPRLKRHLRELEDADKPQSWSHAVGDHIADVGSRLIRKVGPSVMAANREFVLI